MTKLEDESAKSTTALKLDDDLSWQGRAMSTG